LSLYGHFSTVNTDAILSDVISQNKQNGGQKHEKLETVRSTPHLCNLRACSVTAMPSQDTTTHNSEDKETGEWPASPRDQPEVRINEKAHVYDSNNERIKLELQNGSKENRTGNGNWNGGERQTVWHWHLVDKVFHQESKKTEHSGKKRCVRALQRALNHLSNLLIISTPI